MSISFYTVIVVIVYLAIIGFLGFLGYRNTKNASDYLLAGRKTHPLVMALSYGSTFISTAAIVGFGGAAASMGMGLLWLTFLNIFVGIFIAFIFFGKRTRRMGHTLDAHTFPELLGRRFNSKFLQGFAGALIFICMPIYAASVIKGGANFVEQYFGINYKVSLILFVAIVAIYVFMGGMKGVMYTDAFQGGIMFISMIVLLIVAYTALGGIGQAHQKLTNMFSDPGVQKTLANSIKGGFQGWTSMPKGGSPMWWNLVSTIVAGVGIGVLAQPQLAVRFMTVKSDKELNRATLSGGIFILAMTGVAFTVGALSNALFFEKTGQIAITAAGGVSDKIIPTFISTYLPGWFGAIFLIAMLAAAMSTLSGLFHTMGTAAGRDVYEKSFDKKGNTMFITRGGILVVIIISTAWAWFTTGLPQYETIIAKFTTVFFELASAAFLPVFVGALFIKKMPKAAAKWSMISGAIAWFVMDFFINTNAASMQLCKALTGKDSLLIGTPIESWKNIGTSLVALPISILVAVIITVVYNSMKKQDLDSAHIEKCFEGIK